MKFKMVHENYNVYDLQRSLDFYEKAQSSQRDKNITGKFWTDRPL